MKKVFTTLFTLSLISGASAQVAADTVFTGSQYANHQYYSLENGIQATVEYDSWNIGFGVNVMQYDAPIRFNSLAGDIRVLPNADINDDLFDVDTTGWGAEESLYDSDVDIFKGALTREEADDNDLLYFWGKYNTQTHIISPIRTFGALIGSDFYLMRFSLVAMTNIYTIEFAKLGETQSTTKDIDLNNYTGKNYVNFNLAENSIKDQEPLSADWDLFFGKYYTFYMQMAMYPVAGVMNNVGASVAKVISDDVDAYEFAWNEEFSSDNNAIGYDWKNAGPAGVTIADTVVYFIKTKAGDIWKLKFTDFVSGTSSDPLAGAFMFEKEKISAVGVNEVTSIFSQVYPNPSNDFAQIVVDAQANTMIEIYNLNGQKVYETNVNEGLQTLSVNTSNFTNGIYQVVISANGVQNITKLAVQH